ncbi:MAG: response regulator [Butyrivibrio sp.]|nr:response regulator [Muribaculum sp.]MCM1552160.1 response regulator [Butyrivibrio sp.]
METNEANRKKILVVDDEEMSREILRNIFEDQYDIITAENGSQAIKEIGKNMKDLAVILLDLVMPVLNGYQVLQVLNAEKITDRIPVILITGEKDDKQLELTVYALGAASMISKPYDAEIVKRNVNNIISLRQGAAEMEEIIQDQQRLLNIQQRQIEAYNDNLLEAISNIVEFRNLESGTHTRRVKGYTRIIAQTYMQLYPEAGLTKHKIDTIAHASVTHDIGKISIPDSILLKPGRLTDEEREVMMTHTTKGCEILKLLPEELQGGELLAISYEICRHHHERDDGKGYPDGLKGDEIPLSAQLVSLADVYDALVSERCYKKPFDKETAYNMIMEGQCGVFSPKLLKCLETSRNAIELFADKQL